LSQQEHQEDSDGRQDFHGCILSRAAIVL